MVKASVFLMLCGCVLLVDGPAVSDDAPVDCAAPVTQADMNQCAAQDFREADLALNAQWQKTKAALDDWDSSSGVEGKTGAKKLLASQRAWLGYRDSQCDLEGHAMDGGSAQPLLVSSCLADLTRKRTEELKSLGETYTN